MNYPEIKVTNIESSQNHFNALIKCIRGKIFEPFLPSSSFTNKNLNTLCILLSQFIHTQKLHKTHPKKKEKNKSITKVRTNALAFFSKTSTNEEIKILNEPKTGLMFVCIASLYVSLSFTKLHIIYDDAHPPQNN